MSTHRKFECLKDLLDALKTKDVDLEHVQRLRARVEAEFAPLINGDAIALMWMVGDVHDTAKDMCHGLDASPLTDEEAREILATTERRHDASIDIKWEVLSTHIEGKLAEKRAAARLKQATSYLEGLAKTLAERYPHLRISFGYIGNCGMGGANDYDDRSWRFFYAPEAGNPSKSFGGYGTDSLSLFADYMCKDGLETFERILQGHPVSSTDWMCKGSMRLGSGCGKCSRCISELWDANEAKGA